MPSLRSRCFRLFLRFVVRPKFRKAGTSVKELRKLAHELGKHQKLPPGVDVEPVTAGHVPSEWLTPSNAAEDRMILYLHGGGCVMGAPETHRELAARISQACCARVLVIDYRLAPEHPFPAALEDAVSAYLWLLGGGHPPEKIAIGGDSAGGGLALQTLVSVREKGKPLPCAAFMMSPQTDWIHFDGESYRTRAREDPRITLEMCKFFASLYVDDAHPDVTSLSLATLDLSDLPAMLIQVGDREVLLSDSTRLAERAQQAGNDVTLEVWPGLWHAFQSSAAVVPEAREAIEKIGVFVRRHFR